MPGEIDINSIQCNGPNKRVTLQEALVFKGIYQGGTFLFLVKEYRFGKQKLHEMTMGVS